MDFFQFTTIQNNDLQAIQEILSNIECAKDIQLSFKFNESTVLFLNIDFLDLKKDIESQTGSLLSKEQSELQLKNGFHYLHHNIFFKVVGKIFSSLPLVQKVILSAKLQQDSYIVSLEMNRERWLESDFEQIE